MESNNNNEEYDEQNMNEENEILDDDYLIQLHRILQDMKNKRKEAERDANILDGRLKCLRGEEEKTLKKIEVTRRKTELKRENVAQKEEKQTRT